MDDTKFGYKKLRVWQLSRELVVEIHKMSLTKLPKWELDERLTHLSKSLYLFIRGVEDHHDPNRS